MDCPDDNALVRLAHGRAAQDELASLEAHVDGCSACRQLLAAVALGSAPPSSDDRPLLRAGDRLGRYEVERLIGAGGMGVVYVAHDTRLGRRVALKLMRSAFSDDAGAARLLREAQAMARLSHPNVLNVFDLGEYEGRVFVAMELVEGGTLRDWLKPPRDWREIVNAFVAAGEGLAAAHAAGVVHRDFKPANVVVGADGRPRVTDFGLARPGAPQSNQKALPPVAMELTAAGSLLGTPAYMSPEQLLGKSGDARSDQYSFCVALYEALTGKRPFPSDTVEELRARIAGGPPPLPREGPVPAHVWAAIARGLQPAPEARFADMESLLGVLRLEAPARTGVKRRPRVWIGAAVAALALVAAVLSTTEQPRPAAPILAPAPAVSAAPGAAVEPTPGAEPRPDLKLAVGETRRLEVVGLTRLAIGDPSVADARPLGGGSVELRGMSPGRTTLLAWTEAGQRGTFLVEVKAPGREVQSPQ